MSLNMDLFKSVLSNFEASLSATGFSAFSVEGKAVSEDGGEATAFFSGEKGTLKITYGDEKLTVYHDELPESTASFRRIMLCLLNEDADAKDISYVTSEFSETINDKFAEKVISQKKPGAKKPQTVSKAAVKGGASYDPTTLASRLCHVFPELSEPYKANLAKYGDFMSEEFFVEYGTPAVIAAIKQNHPQTMKKLFQVLNEIYEDGTNDTQSLIAVTILGELNNDQLLLANCVDYMSQTMAPPVIEVNKFLATSGGKKAKKKLLNPPAYKPQKQKKAGFMDKLMNPGNTQGGINQQ